MLIKEFRKGLGRKLDDNFTKICEKNSKEGKLYILSAAKREIKMRKER